MRIACLTATALPFLAAGPALAAEAASPRLSLPGVFAHAAPPVQAIALLLLAASIAAPLLRDRARRLLTALAVAGPQLALAAVAFTGLAGAVGYANSPVPPSPTVLAPAWAEMLLLTLLGLLAAVSAVLSLGLAKDQATAAA
jgi:hypothetical protein